MVTPWILDATSMEWRASGLDYIEWLVELIIFPCLADLAFDCWLLAARHLHKKPKKWRLLIHWKLLVFNWSIKKNHNHQCYDVTTDILVPSHALKSITNGGLWCYNKEYGIDIYLTESHDPIPMRIRIMVSILKKHNIHYEFKS